jgi:glycerol-3-phosphate dehydrogenase
MLEKWLNYAPIKLNLMANFNIDAKQEMTYDAIVIGSGISGGWAAKELCEKGLKTLVLERGDIHK